MLNGPGVPGGGGGLFVSFSMVFMCDLWRTSNMNYGAKWAFATNPKKLQSIATKKRLLDRALWEQGIRYTSLPAGVNRHEWKAAHGYRKFYKSRAEQVMKPINVEANISI